MHELHGDHVGDAEPIRHPVFQLRNQPAVGEHAAVVGGPQPGDDGVEVRTSWTSEWQRGREARRATEDGQRSACGRVLATVELGIGVAVELVVVDHEAAIDAASAQHVLQRLGHLAIVGLLADVLEGAQRLDQVPPLPGDLGAERGDGRVAARLEHLGIVVQPLVETLARAGADHTDLDVVVGPQTGQADHLPGQTEDRRRLAHVEQVDAPLGGHRTRLQDQAHGLRDGHEVAGHLRVGDRDRPAGEDLAQEGGNDTAAAAEHVAEPHRDERKVVLAADLEHDLFGSPLGRTHHRARIGGLVSRDVHESLTAGLGRDLGQPPRAEHVGRDGLAGVAFEDGHVLVGGGVEHDVGAVPVEQLAQPLTIADVEQDRLGVGERTDHHLVQQALVPVEQQQPLWAEAGDLEGDLAADGTARSRDEHGGARQVASDVLGVDRGVLAPEQVGDVEVAHASQQRPADRFGARGQNLDLGVGLEGQVDDGLELVLGHVRQGDEDPVDLVGTGEQVENGCAPEHRQAPDRAPGEPWVVVDEPDDLDVAVAIAVGELVSEGGPGAAGSHDQRSLAAVGPGPLTARGRRGEPGSGCRHSPAARAGRRPEGW